MENDVMLGEMSGMRRRGITRTRWLDNTDSIKGPPINSTRWDVRDRDRWKSATAVVARVRARFDGTM